MKIGLFDSGLGGLTILKEVVREIPEYNYLYYGDTKNLPYGDRSESEIYDLTTKGMEYLFSNNCLLNIIACNTASAETARRLQNEFLPMKYPDRKILGIIVPTIEELTYTEPTRAILLATKRTVDSGKYSKELALRGNGNTKLIPIATPSLVPLIEKHDLAKAVFNAIAEIDKQIGESDVVVLGCSHYTQIKEPLRDYYENKKQIISQDEIIPKKLKQYLTAHPEIESRLTRGGERKIFLTEHRPDYDRLIGHFLGGLFVGE
jgi:glutamate racemase